jgi:glycosidase
MKKLNNDAVSAYPYELRIFYVIRKEYELSETIFGTDGRLVFADFLTVRSLAHKLNTSRSPEEHVYPGELYAAGLLHEIYHFVLRKYEDIVLQDIFISAEKLLEKQMGKAAFMALLTEFTNVFPPSDVFKGKVSASQHLSSGTGGKPNTSIAIEELLMLMLANENPANKKIKTLIDNRYLSSPENYTVFTEELTSFFKQLPPFGPETSDVINMLRAPFVHAPDDYDQQLDYVAKHWKHILPDELLLKILKGKDLMKEDYMLAGGFGPPPAIAPNYKGGAAGGMHLGKSGYDAALEAQKDYDEPERFTEDTDWMPRVVLMAKNTYVWLDQLSKKHERHIRTLDQVPDEELDRLARSNINGLWLIGVWERSVASRKIKHKMGNIDAVSSAYSLYDYEIAHDLGGDHAYRVLNEKARKRGIRLASDMVPNHTGIFSKWVIEHPNYFIQSRVPPFPGYTFNSENLSDDPNVEIRIEDGYYSKSDAAVVFQRIDRQNNDVRYIYHGNDGTMMPWNDTAQLDMIKTEVRQAVINKIFDVAKKFSIIRFDAAMTLAKKHFARLWYPRPGTGGDIPSRADHAMTQEAFDAVFPIEFWREVVDRINNEMPETLLLAEAFWFMEGYFVRTLGMHRVYNSAFMHMLKNEENEKYRELITNTLEFEPEILKRYVNFMSNPDEETAIQQFGTGDKYFGVCVMMNTLPGLPMFAHGQIEGYTEKYGMEYQRAYYNEQPNEWLVEKHEREIFPLTKKRYLFSGVSNFNIFNFSDDHGIVNENVFAYTNRHGDERALVLFNNKYDMASGHIKTSAPRLQKTNNEKQLTSFSLGDALALKNDNHTYYTVREHISGQEYLFSGDDIHHRGFSRHLNGFEYCVFINFNELPDKDGEVATLYERIRGQGVPSVQETLALQKLHKTHNAFLEIFKPEALEFMVGNIVKEKDTDPGTKNRQSLTEGFRLFAMEVCAGLRIADKSPVAENAFAEKLDAIHKAMAFIHASQNRLNLVLRKEHIGSPGQILMLSSVNNYRENSLVILALYMLQSLTEMLPENMDAVSIFNKLMLDRPIRTLMAHSGRSPENIDRDMLLMNVLQKYGHALFDFSGEQDISAASDGKQPLPASRTAKAKLALTMLADPQVKDYIGANEYESVWYYSKESFEHLCKWLFTLAYHDYFTRPGLVKNDLALKNAVKESTLFYLLSQKLSANAAYKLDELTKNLEAILR